MNDNFDPFTQNIILSLPDGNNVTVSLADVDKFNAESVSICVSYGAQFGASFIMLVTVLVMTPRSKFRRPSNVLHVIGLLLSSIRLILLTLYFPSPFNDFYAFWAGDYSHVPDRDYNISIAANTFTLFVVMTIEAALMNQAWTMVTLWPSFWKYSISIISACVTLLTIGSRIAFTVIQNKAVLSLVPPENHRWLIYWAIITNAISICWFCALFNVKLVIHLITNRGVLPSYKGLSPMEILVMTNGVLMVIPVIFSGLEWGTFTNFEAASWTLTSVVIILPLGTLAAQRIAHSGSFIYSSDSSGGRLGDGTHPRSSAPLKASFATSSRATTQPHITISSRCEAGMSSQDKLNPEDLELGSLYHTYPLAHGRVRVDRNLEQHDERM